MSKILFPALTTILFMSFCVVGFCQETITITTYYPAPFGVYRDLQVTGGLQANGVAASFQIAAPIFWDDFITVETAYGDIIGIGGDAVDAETEIRVWTPVAAREVVAFRDTAGNLISIRALNVGGASIVPYGPVGSTDCPAGQHVVGVLDNNREGVNMTHVNTITGWQGGPPASGFIICH